MTTECPSRSWDRLTAGDGPEVCPMCGAANADDTGVAVCADAPDFCSVACRDRYVADERTRDAAYAAALTEEDEIARAWAKLNDDPDFAHRRALRFCTT